MKLTEMYYPLQMITNIQLKYLHYRNNIYAYNIIMNNTIIFLLAIGAFVYMNKEVDAQCDEGGVVGQLGDTSDAPWVVLALRDLMGDRQ